MGLHSAAPAGATLGTWSLFPGSRLQLHSAAPAWAGITPSFRQLDRQGLEGPEQRPFGDDLEAVTSHKLAQCAFSVYNANHERQRRRAPAYA